MNIDKMLNIYSVFTGYKIDKPIDNEQKSKIVEILAQEISAVCKTKTKQEIINLLNENNTGYLINRTGRFGICPDGIYSPTSNNLYVKDEFIEYMIESGKSSPIVIHEAIHKLQKIPLFYRGKEIRGFMEGATEYYALKTDTLGKRGSIMDNGKVRYNIPYSPYVGNVTIMAQLGIAFGEEKLEDFAFGENKELLDEMRLQYGNNFYETMRKGLNSFIKTEDHPDMARLINELQTLILDVCYQRKYDQIKSIDDAIAFFTELKSIDDIRQHILGDNYFKNFYEQKYSECVLRFPEAKDTLRTFEYKEPTFLKVQSLDEIKESLDNLVLNCVCTSRVLEENITAKNRYRRYAVLLDGNLHHLLLCDGKPFLYNIANEMDEDISARLSPTNDSGNYEVNIPDSSGNSLSAYTILQSDAGIILKNGDQEVKFRAIELGITDEDLEYQTEYNKSVMEQNLTLIERISNIFKRKQVPLLDSAHTQESKTEFLSGLKVEQSNSETSPCVSEKSPSNKKSLENIDDIISEL